MKQKFFLSYLLFFVFIYLFFMPGDAISQILESSVSVEPRVVNKKNEVIEAPQINFYSYCYDIRTGEKNKCTFGVTISRANDETCSGAPGIKCGHINAQQQKAMAEIYPNSPATICMVKIAEKFCSEIPKDDENGSIKLFWESIIDQDSG